MDDILTTETGCTISLARTENVYPHLPPGWVLTLRMKQPGDGRYAEVVLTDNEANVLGIWLGAVDG